MTLWATRDGQQVTIHGNVGLALKIENGRVETGYSISEDLGQMRSLWGSLGRLIEEADAERQAAEPAEGGT